MAILRHRSALLRTAMTSVAAICLSVVAGGRAQAETVEWIGAGSWSNAANWQTVPDGSPIVPDIDDDVFIYKPGPVIDKPGNYSNSITVAGPNGSFTITAGGSLDTYTNANIGVGPSMIGTVTVTGAGALWDSTKVLNLGVGGGVGNLIVSNGGRVNADEIVVGAGAGAVSTLTVSGPSSVVRAYDSVVIGAGAGTRGTIVVSDGGTLTTSGSFFTLGSTTGGSQMFIGGGTMNASDATLPGVVNASLIEFTGSGNSINFNHTDTSGTYTFAPALLGDGVLNFIRGTTILTADSSNFVGATNVLAGAKLSVRGSLSGSDVSVWGILGGNGDVKSATVYGNGVVEPGNSVGTLHITNNFAMSAGSAYQVELNGQASDLIVVGGTANIQSSVFEIAHDTNTLASPVLPGKTYTIITTGGGLTVTAPSVAIADFPFLSFALSADAFNGYLTTSRSAERFTDLASTPNQRAVANVLDTALVGSPLWQQVVGATEAQARASFASLSNASLHASAAGVLSAQSQDLRDAVTDRLRQDFGGAIPLAISTALSFASDTSRNAYAAAEAIPFVKAPPAGTSTIYAAWAQALGSWGSLKGDSNTGRTDYSLGGVISGIDATFSGTWRVGLAGGYSQSLFNLSGIAASGSSDSYHVALYGGGSVGDWGFRSGASFSWNDILTTRQAGAINVFGPQRGDYGMTTTQVFGEVGRSFARTYGTIEPFANVAYVKVDGNVSETGVAAVTGSAGLDTVYTTLGAHGVLAVTSMLTARGTLAWRHAFGDTTPVATLAFQSGGPSFALSGSPIAGDALVTEAGIDLAVSANAALGASWSGQFADRAVNNTFKGSFKWQF